MHRSQILLPADLHRQAAETAKARRTSLGHLVREALREYLARSRSIQPSDDAIEDVLLAVPFDDPDPDPELSTNVDHYLYGARRRSRQRTRRRR